MQPRTMVISRRGHGATTDTVYHDEVTMQPRTMVISRRGHGATTDTVISRRGHGATTDTVIYHDGVTMQPRTTVISRPTRSRCNHIAITVQLRCSQGAVTYEQIVHSA